MNTQVKTQYQWDIPWRATCSKLHLVLVSAGLAWGVVASVGRLAPIAGPGPRPRYFFPYPNLLRAPTKPPPKTITRLESHQATSQLRTQALSSDLARRNTHQRLRYHSDHDVPYDKGRYVPLLIGRLPLVPMQRGLQGDPEKQLTHAGVLGCTGSVGQRFILLLKDHQHIKLHAVGASSRSAGKKYKDAVQWKQASPIGDAGELVIKECKASEFADCDVVFSGLDSSVAGDIGEFRASLCR